MIKYLEITLDPKPIFKVINTRELEYKPIKIKTPECIGLLDLLRNRSREVIGIRLWPFDEAAEILERVNLSSHITTRKPGWEWSILARDEEWDENLSADQILCDAELFFNQNKTLILMIDGSIFPDASWSQLVSVFEN